MPRGTYPPNYPIRLKAVTGKVSLCEIECDGDHKEEVYMKLPQKFQHKSSYKVCRLLMCLYRLCQAPW